jgi:ribosomal protein S21
MLLVKVKKGELDEALKELKKKIRKEKLFEDAGFWKPRSKKRKIKKKKTKKKRVATR